MGHMYDELFFHEMLHMMNLGDCFLLGL